MLGEIMKTQFAAVGGAITLDGWTDDFKRINYLGVTVHYVEAKEEKWVVNDRVLSICAMDIDTPKTGEYFKSELDKILSAFNLVENIANIVFVTDRGSNMLVAVRNMKSITCFAHFLNNLVKAACSSGDLKQKIFKPLSSTVKYMKINGLNNLFEKGLRSYVQTQFWRIGMNFRKYRIRNIKKESVTAITKFLLIFKESTDEIEKSKEPPLHLVWPCYNNILRVLTVDSNDYQFIKKMKTAAIDYFDKNFKFHMLHKISVFLHPHMKGLKHCTNEHDKLEIYD